MKFRMNKVGKMCGGTERMFKCRSLGMNAKKRLSERVVVPTVLYRAETWRVRDNVMEMRCLRSICGFTQMDEVRNEMM